MYKELLYLKSEMKKYHRDKSVLVKYYINKRLNDSLNSYYKDLEYSIKYLDNRQPENILKKMED
jgi:hypothetical protein